MKLKNLLRKEIYNNEQMLDEKKEVIGQSPLINLTFHLDHKFSNVGENGKPELSFTISVSSTGGKEYYRNISDQAEKEKFELAVRKEINKAAKRLNKNMDYIINKYQLQPRTEE
jgi:hypothetical protein